MAQTQTARRYTRRTAIAAMRHSERSTSAKSRCCDLSNVRITTLRAKMAGQGESSAPSRPAAPYVLRAFHCSGDEQRAKKD